MSLAPQISIVIAAYNAERYLAETLDSILAQTFPDWECVIIDDGSSDSTVGLVGDYVQRDSRFRLATQPNGGVSVARNHGYRITDSNAPYAIFMDHDDVWLPDALATLLEEMERHPEAAGVHALAEMIDGQGQIINEGSFADFGRSRTGFDGKRISAWPMTAPTNFAVLTNCFTLYPPGLILISKKHITLAGLYDPFFKSGGEDWDFFSRLSRHGDFHIIDKVIILYRRHGNNGSNDAERMHGLARLVKHRIFFSEANNSKQKSIAKGAYRAWQSYKIAEKQRLIRDSVQRRNYAQMAKYTFHIVWHQMQYGRGYPTLRG